MSDKTKEALNKAIKEHMADEMEGAYLTDYVLTAVGMSANKAGTVGYMNECSDSAPHIVYGLAGMGLDYFSSDEDE